MTNLSNILNKYSKGSIAHFEFEKKERPFVKLQDLQEKTRYTIQAIFVNNSKFGEQGLIVTEDAQVNLPKHLTTLCKELRNDVEVVEAINSRQLAFEIYSYSTDAGRVGYSINLTTSDATPSDTKNRAFGTDEMAF